MIGLNNKLKKMKRLMKENTSKPTVLRGTKMVEKLVVANRQKILTQCIV